MTPDFAYFLPLGVSRGQSHSLAGLLWFCLPVGGVTYALFHGLVREPVIALMPSSLAARLSAVPSPAPRGVRGALVIGLSLLLGALTHIAWDAFTHRGGVAVAALPSLQAVVFRVGRYPMPVYRILQHASSLLGLGVLARSSWRWLATAPTARAVPPRPLSAVTRAAIAIGILLIAVGMAAEG